MAVYMYVCMYICTYVYMYVYTGRGSEVRVYKALALLFPCFFIIFFVEAQPIAAIAAEHGASLHQFKVI